jgi:hypothetical protein
MNQLFPAPGESVTLVNNGDHLLVVPPSELREIDAIAAELAVEDSAPKCEQCSEPFQPRKGSGGKRQRFCSEPCRRAFHAAADSQRGPTPVQQQTLPVPPEPKPAIEPASDDSGWYWSLPYQAKVEVSRTTADEIEIEEHSPVHTDENVRIIIARSNAVRLARCILFAAGFKTANLATRCKGGYCDLEDGSLPEDFDY